MTDVRTKGDHLQVSSNGESWEIKANKTSIICSGSAVGGCPAFSSNAINRHQKQKSWRYHDGKGFKEGIIKISCSTHCDMEPYSRSTSRFEMESYAERMERQEKKQAQREEQCLQCKDMLCHCSCAPFRCLGATFSCLDDPEDRLARQSFFIYFSSIIIYSFFRRLDREINAELKRARQTMVMNLVRIHWDQISDNHLIT